MTWPIRILGHVQWIQIVGSIAIKRSINTYTVIRRGGALPVCLLQYMHSCANISLDFVKSLTSITKLPTSSTYIFN